MFSLSLTKRYEFTVGVSEERTPLSSKKAKAFSLAGLRPAAISHLYRWAIGSDLRRFLSAGNLDARR